MLEFFGLKLCCLGKGQELPSVARNASKRQANWCQAGGAHVCVLGSGLFGASVETGNLKEP